MSGILKGGISLTALLRASLARSSPLLATLLGTVGTTTLAPLALSNSNINENSPAGTPVGSIQNLTAGSSLSLSADGSGHFAISGTALVATSTPTDYETAPSFSVTIVETLAGAVGTPKSTTLTIGVVNLNDTNPSAFTFTDVTGAPLSTLETSNTITVAGLGASDSATASISGDASSQFQKNGGTWGTAPVSVVNGDTLAVRHSSAASVAVQVTTTLTVGTTSDTFSSTTGSALTAPGFFIWNGTSDVTSATGLADPPLFDFTVPDSSVGEGDFVEFQIDTANTYNTGNLRTESRQLVWDGTLGTTGKLSVDGDSLTASGASSYATVWGVANPAYTVVNHAVGGSGLSDLMTRQSAVLADHPDVFTVLIGTNDLSGGGADGNAEAAGLLNYTDTIRAGGAKVGVWTAPPKYIAADPTHTASYAVARANFNTAIRAALVSNRIDAIIDLAADPIMGPDAAATDTSLYADGTHPTSLGYSNLATLANPVLNRLFNFGNFVFTDPGTNVPHNFTIHTGLTPSTTYYARRRFRRDYGDTSVYSSWTEVSLSVASSGITFAWNPSNLSTWDSAHQTLSNSNRTWLVTTAAAGANSSIRSTLNIVGNGVKRYFEYNPDVWDAAGSGGLLGVATDTYGGTGSPGSLASVGDALANLSQTAGLKGSSADLYVANSYVATPAGVDIAPANHAIGFAIRVNASDSTLWVLKDGVCGHGDPVAGTGGYTLPFTQMRPIAALNPDGGANQSVTINTLAAATTRAPSGFTPAGA